MLVDQDSLAVGVFKPFIPAAHSERVKTGVYPYEGIFMILTVVVVVVVVSNEVDLMVSLCLRCCFCKSLMNCVSGCCFELPLKEYRCFKLPGRNTP